MNNDWRKKCQALQESGVRIGRRRTMLGLSACVAGVFSSPDAFAQAAVCVLTPDAGEGPFYFDPDLLRADITDGALGAPLDIALQITDAEHCAPLTAARVDVWQADGYGLYSGYRDQPGVGVVETSRAVGKTFLRGTQRTDADGWVRFRTIYPSWYGGRTPHVHFKVWLGAREVVASQTFFPDELTAEIFREWEPYRNFVDRRVGFNTNDPFLDGRIDGVFCEIEDYGEDGVRASAVIVVPGA
jgi:protocatechuate 3,4-dioxygenase beta subunit